MQETLMPAVAGADISEPVTNALIQSATQALGNKPAFLGRYFKNPQNPETVQYQFGTENAVLREAAIPILCLARQTARVGGTSEDGIADAVWNMAAIVEAFGLKYLNGLGHDPIVFLDTEPETTLSSDYYLGWAGALRNQGEYVPEPQPAFTVRFTPAIYINQGDDDAWKALTTAMGQGASCYGAWVAHYIENSAPPPWDPQMVQPNPPLQAPCPIIAWQYIGDYQSGNLDFSILEATSANATLQLLIPAPPGSGLTS
jgi:hypothetical protein